MTKGQKIIIEWIDAGLEKEGKTRGALAKLLGVHPSAVTRILAGKRAVKAHEMPVIARYLESAPPSVPANDGEEATKVTFPVGKLARVVGEVAAGRWEETSPFADPHDDIENDQYKPVTYVDDPRYPNIEQFAVRVAGNSVNKRIPDGFFAVCVPYFSARREFTDGDLVVVQRKRSGLYEGTIKELSKTKNGWELRPVSTDPKHQTPIPLQDSKKGEVEVEIVGLVIWQVGPV